MTHLFDVPQDSRDLLAQHGWGADTGGARLTLDEADLAGRIFGGPLGDWAQRIVSGVNATMPATTGVAYLDQDFHIVGVGMSDGMVAGASTDNVITDLPREDACFTLRAFDEGYQRVRPMPNLPVAIIHETLTAPVTAAATAVEVPEDSKVFIEVDPDNDSIVYDVWAVAPTGGTSQTSGVGIWRRHASAWVPDPGFFNTLQGEQVPRLVYMAPDAPLLGSVLAQVDESTKGQAFEPLTAGAVVDVSFYVAMLPIVAAGGLKKMAGVGKGGNAETLREYWTKGKGAAKIRWGQGGDWYRCVKQLKKYMGTRAKGYCNLMHKRALGYYPTTHKKMIEGKKGLAASAEPLRDRDGHWVNPDSLVRWDVGDRRCTGRVVGAPAPGWVTVKEPGFNQPYQIRSSRISLLDDISETSS